LRLSRILDNRKDGTKGKPRIDYGDPRNPKEPIKWLWRFIEGAHTAGELYGRALVVIAAEQYASRLAVPTSQRSRPTGWGSHKDRARKALTKLAGPHLPASLKQLEKAIAKIHAEHDQAVSAPHAQPERPPSESDAAEPDTAGDDEIAGPEG